jgi:hypothetical protein
MLNVMTWELNQLEVLQYFSRICHEGSQGLDKQFLIGLKHAKGFLQGPSVNTEQKPVKMGITSSPSIERCLETGESATHIPGDCQATVYLRFRHLRQQIAGFLPRRPGFEPGSGHVGFVIYKVA